MSEKPSIFVSSTCYPSGREVVQTFDAKGRLASVAGQVSAFSYGNGVSASFGFNAARLQLESLSYANGSTTLLSLAYGYTQNGGNNGQITSITDNTGTQEGGRSVSYTYDALHRLKTAVTTESTSYPQWGLEWSYDRYGNRTQQSILSGCQSPMTCPTNSVSVDAATNRLTGSPYTYDENGNMTNDGLNTLTYDAESRVVRVNSSNPMYVYDGAGLRVKKCDPHCTSPTTTTVYIFSGTQVIAEYVNGAAVNSPTREYIYSGSQLIATHESSALKFHHQDHLSRRVTTDAAGALVSQQGHFPFGEQWFSKDGSGNPVTPGKLFFTNYERDSESGNDFAIFRYYSNRNGRFCSADPMAGSTANPQSLNRYAYALNDPVNLIDPLGLEIECFQAFQVRVESDSETGEVLSVSVTPLGTFCFTGLVFPDYAPANDGKAPLDPKDSKEYEEQRRNALEKLNNKKCREFLTKALGAAGVEALKQAIQNQVPWNGSNSTISLADAQVIDPNNQTQAAMEYFANTSVAQHLRRRSGVGAVAQVGGPDVYFRSRNGFERLFGMAGSFRPRDVIHEALHASTGMADPGLVGLLDPTGKYKGEDSWRINVALMANNCK